MFLILGGIAHFYNTIADNGWLNAQRSDMNPWFLLFLISAIPICRFICVCAIVYMSTHTFSEYDRSRYENDHDD